LHPSAWQQGSKSRLVRFIGLSRPKHLVKMINKKDGVVVLGPKFCLSEKQKSGGTRVQENGFPGTRLQAESPDCDLNARCMIQSYRTRLRQTRWLFGRHDRYLDSAFQRGSPVDPCCPRIGGVLYRLNMSRGMAVISRAYYAVSLLQFACFCKGASRRS
jgi:hypothetical protein